MRRTTTALIALAFVAVAAPVSASATKHGPQGPPPPLEPLQVFHWPSFNDGGGSHAYGTWGLPVLVQATKPSNAAKRLCDTAMGQHIDMWGAVATGSYTRIVTPPFYPAPSQWDVSVVVTDPDGTHGGGCEAYLRYEG